MNCGKKFAEVADDKKQGNKEERGATLVEYALLVALIAVVAITAITALGTGVSSKFSSVTSSLSTATN